MSPRAAERGACRRDHWRLLNKMLKHWKGSSGEHGGCLPVLCPLAGVHAWGRSLLGSPSGLEGPIV